MLETFKKFLDTHGYYHEHEIRNIPHSCCNTLTHKVIDFDKIKDDFCKSLKVGCKLKSVDALFFPNNKPNELFLVEMTSYRTYSFRTGKAGMKDCIAFIDNEFDGFNLPNKIIDSIYIILSLIGYYSINTKFYSYILDIHKLKLRTILLLDLTDEEIFDLTYLSLNKRNISLTKRIDGEIIILNCNKFVQYFS